MRILCPSVAAVDLHKNNSLSGYTNLPPSFQNCRIRYTLVWFDAPRRAESNHTRASRIRQFWTKL